MRTRERRRLAQMVAAPPRRAPRWLTPEMVLEATSLDGLDVVMRSDMAARRVQLLLAIVRTSLDELRAALER